MNSVLAPIHFAHQFSFLSKRARSLRPIDWAAALCINCERAEKVHSGSYSRGYTSVGEHFIQ